MSEQITLEQFEQSVKRLSRIYDPKTSKDAAKKILPKLQAQQHDVLDAIRKFYRTSDFTSKELAMRIARNQTSLFAHLYYMVSRRLKELSDYIERTGETRNGCSVWRLKQ